MTEISTINPATGETLRAYAAMTPDDVGAAVAAAVGAQRGWAATPATERAAKLLALAAALRDRAEPLAALATAETGKPLAESHGEVEKSAVTAEYYAAQGAALLADAPVDIAGPAGITRGSLRSPLAWFSASCRGTSRSGR